MTALVAMMKPYWLSGTPKFSLAYTARSIIMMAAGMVASTNTPHSATNGRSRSTGP